MCFDNLRSRLTNYDFANFKHNTNVVLDRNYLFFFRTSDETVFVVFAEGRKKTYLHTPLVVLTHIDALIVQMEAE